MPEAGTGTGNPPAELSDRWKRWIVDNAVAGVSPADIGLELVRRGLPPEQAADPLRLVGADFLLEHGLRPERALRRKYELLLGDHSKLDALSGTELAERHDISGEEFFDRFYLRNRPVVLRGIAAGSGLLDWSPAALREQFGNLQVQVQTGRRAEPIWDVFLRGKTSTMLLADYVDLVLSAEETNEFYLTANENFLAHDHDRRILADVAFADALLEAEHRYRGTNLWLGPAGTVSPLHRDRVNVLNVQTVGSKRITLIDSCQLPRVYNHQSYYSMVDVERPDLDRYPEFADVTVRSAVLQPGDAVFIPVNWWHHLRALQVSVSITFVNFRLDNTFGNGTFELD
ncbi:cupin-like domain-containing protein [Jatrophihabitans sp.]|jgi:hypothetical protein|uniref:cupin-like domain-containing protein n=1 Tax=Jatrophihabitans sp. TaxID=1932789 RepID=UPI002EE4C744